MILNELNPELFTGQITKNTPFCVANFCAAFFKITLKKKYWYNDDYVGNFNETKNKIENVTVQLPFEECEEKIMNRCIRFLNPFTKKDFWNSNSIVSGINHSFSILNSEFSENSEFGNKTNSDPLKINILLSYYICKKYNYVMDFNTEENEIFYAAKYFINPNKLPELRKFTLENIKYIPDEHIVKSSFSISFNNNVEKEISKKLEDGEVIIEEKNIGRVFKLLDNTTFLLQRFKPETKEEAILISLSKFGIYLGEALDPIYQHNILSKRFFSKKNIHKYVPVNDNNFCIKYSRNQEWYSSENWFPELLSTYDEEELLKFSKKEGYRQNTETNERILIAFLQERRKQNNFYFGISPYCDDEETIMLTNISEVPTDQLICFGSIEDKTLKYFTLEELTLFYDRMKMFIDPLTRKQLNASVLLKLKNYVSEMKEDKNKDKAKFTDLYNKLVEIDEAKSLIDLKVRELSIKIKDMETSERNKIKSFFGNVLDMGFYMRGWRINKNEEYPLSSGQCYYDPKYKIDVMDNTCIAFSKVNEVLNTIDEELRSDLKLLNSIMFSSLGKEKKIFEMKMRGVVVCRDRTLYQCMYDSIYGDPVLDTSCIRTNSNWILFSALWYMYFLGFESPVNISAIEESL